MNASIERLRALGQSLWLDNITRPDARRRHARALHRRAVGHRPDLEPDDLRAGHRRRRLLRRADRRSSPAPASRAKTCSSPLALHDLTRAADLFRPIHDATGGVDGWVSLEVSPLLADDAEKTIAAARAAARRGGADQPLHQDPGNAGRRSRRSRNRSSPACRSTSRCCSRASTIVAAAEAYLRGIERRIAAGLDPKVESVASLFVSRWDVAVERPGRARAAQSPRHRHRQADLQGVPRAARRRRAGNGSPPPARIRSGCSGRAPASRIPTAPDTLYLEALAAPDTVNTVPEKTLKAFAEHGKVRRADARSTAAMPRR